MKVVLFPSDETDIIHQFRYYILKQGAHLIGLQFREAVIASIEQLRLHPRMGALVRGSIPGLRSWPVKEFDMIRLYYMEDLEQLQVIRILHGSRDVRRILAEEKRAWRSGQAVRDLSKRA